jgi:hypothetical protein
VSLIRSYNLKYKNDTLIELSTLWPSKVVIILVVISINLYLFRFKSNILSNIMMISILIISLLIIITYCFYKSIWRFDNNNHKIYFIIKLFNYKISSKEIDMNRLTRIEITKGMDIHMNNSKTYNLSLLLNNGESIFLDSSSNLEKLKEVGSKLAQFLKTELIFHINNI